MKALQENIIDSIIIWFEDDRATVINIASGIDEVSILKQLKNYREHILSLDEDGHTRVIRTSIKVKGNGPIRIGFEEVKYQKLYYIAIQIPYMINVDAHRNKVYIKYIDGSIIDIIDFFDLVCMTYDFENNDTLNDTDSSDIVLSKRLKISLVRSFIGNKLRSMSLGIVSKDYTIDRIKYPFGGKDDTYKSSSSNI